MGVLRKFVMTIYQKVLKFSDVIITQSKAMDLDVRNYINKKKIIYNPIVNKEISDLSKNKKSLN